MRKLLKFLHTMGAIGVIGAMACLLVMLARMPPATALPEYAAMRSVMGTIASWLFLPSLGVTLIAGLLSIAFNPAFHSAGWAWAKLASGILIFEGGFISIIGPMQAEAERSAEALAEKIDPATLATALTAERNTLWIILGVATANVVFGIWRPRLMRVPT